MNLQQLDRFLAQPESLAEAKSVVRELARREKEASKSDPRASFQLELFKLKAQQVIEDITLGKVQPGPRAPQSFVVPKGMLKPAKTSTRPSSKGTTPNGSQKKKTKPTAPELAAKKAAEELKRAQKKEAQHLRQEVVRAQARAKLAEAKRKIHYPPTPAIKPPPTKAAPALPPPPPKPKPKVPGKPAYIVEYEEMMARFRQLAKLVMMPTPTAAALESKARSEAAMRKLEAEFDAWQRKYPPQQFPWPKLVSGAGTGTMDFAMASHSPLAELGYKVGKTAGLPEEERRRILDYAFANRLPPIESPAYMAEWGPPRTPDRLRRMAEHLAQTYKMFRSRSPTTFAVALEHWKADLAYLKRTYYEQRFRWSWPM